jgi:hypothetical protein
MLRRCILALCFVASGAALDRLVLAQPTGITRTVLLTTNEPGSKTHEAVVALAELQPGAISGRHRHPGIEIGYVLEGTVRMEHDGRPARDLKAGDTFKNDGVHNATVPAGGHAKVLAVYIVEKGKPLSEPVASR